MAGGKIFTDAVGFLKEIDDSAFSPYLEVQVLCPLDPPLDPRLTAFAIGCKDAVVTG